MKWAVRCGLLAIFAALLAGNAKADPVIYSYTLTGPNTASFTLPEFPTVTSSLSQFGFTVTPTDLIINGTPTTDTLFFYSGTPLLGGIPVPGPSGGLSGFIFPSLAGPQLYTGDEGSPQMLLGSFTLDDFNGLLDIPPVSIPYTLNVTTVSTPEPSTLLLFGTGLTALFLMRKRRLAS